MIEIDHYVIQDIEYDRRICPSDWRYSASIVGMVRYFRYYNINHEVDNQYLYYNYDSVNNKSDSEYMHYVEYRYSREMHHVVLEQLLDKEEKSEDDYKQIKEKLGANTILKKIFKDINIDGGPWVIKSLIDENREEIISNTFKNAKFGYAKFSNSYKFRAERDKICRLNGYYVDTGRKTKSLSFSFDDSTRNYSDYIEFDFIPFAFTTNRESVFINSNFNIIDLLRINNKIDTDMRDENDSNFRSKLFYSYQEGSEYVDFDVEIILKDMDKEYFETIFVRKEAIDIFKSIKNLDSNKGYINMALNRSIKITDNYYINMMKEVTNNILNLLTLDELIMFLFNFNDKRRIDSKKRNNDFLISQLIRINRLIYGEKLLIKENGNMSHRNVRQSIEAVKKQLAGRSMKHKIDAYRSKLIGALVANDNDRFIEIMLQLQSYTQVPFNFLHYLIRDFEGNKNLAYDFVNQLNFFKLATEEIKKEEN